MSEIDLLSTVEYGGCSAKLSPDQLSEVLGLLTPAQDPNLMVDISTHDDAGVYKLNDETALIYTTDFFPPVCSDPREFGQIAAANAISDVYAMGGKPLMALNLMMYSADKLPIEGFAEISLGGQDKALESGTLIVGGHTIDDHPPKYGMAVIGVVHPDRLISNGGASVGEKLILTKPLGTGALIAGHREGMADPACYQAALDQMKLLNKVGAELMQKYDVKAGTDVTGFALLGHAREVARASGVSLRIDSSRLPILDQVYELFEDGCIPGAAFRNLSYVESDVEFAADLDYNLRMLACDAQTSGGLLIAVAADKAEDMLTDLKASGVHDRAAIIGEVIKQGDSAIYLD